MYSSFLSSDSKTVLDASSMPVGFSELECEECQ